MRTFRVGMVGLSGIAVQPGAPALRPALGTVMPHSHAAAYALLPQAQVVAVCDLRADLLDKFERLWGGAWQDVHRYTDYRAMLDGEQLDLLSVATPDHRHAQVVVDASAAGVKGIFCEKPFATTLADADRMIAAAERHSTVLTVDHWPRWSAPTLQAQELLRAGAIGTLRRIIQTVGGPRAMLFRNGTYAMDWICYFAGAEPVEVFGRLDPEFDAYGPRYAGDGGHDPRTDPGGAAYVGFANGVRAFYNVSQGTVPHEETFLMGDAGWIRFGDDLPLEVAERRPTDAAPKRWFPPARQYVRTGLVAALAELFSILEHGGESSCGPREARKSVELMLGLLQSHAAGGKLLRLPLAGDV